MNGTPAKTRQFGFTMLELMMTLTVIGIVAAVGIPTFKYVTASNRVAAEINGMLGDLQFARSLAIKQGEPVTVCIANTTGTGCLVGAAGAWQNGWIIFLDSNGNQAVDAGETVVRVQHAFTGTDTFVASVTTVNALTYNRMGYGPTGQTANINIKLHTSPVNNAWTRCLAVNPIGAATTVKYGVGTPACS